MIIGYFIWIKTMKGVECEKIHAAILDGMQPLTTKKAYEAKVVSSFPLDDSEWPLSLRELAVMYPAPGAPRA